MELAAIQPIWAAHVNQLIFGVVFGDITITLITGVV